MQLGWNDENNSFHIDEHKISNTGMNDEMAMKRRGWTKGKPLLRECWTFLIYIIRHQQWKQCLEFALAKLRKICKKIFGWCLQFKHSCLWSTLSYFCLQNKAGKINATRRVVLRKCIKRAQCYLSSLKCGEVPLQIGFTTLPPKNHNLFVKLDSKKGIGEKGIAATG